MLKGLGFFGGKCYSFAGGGMSPWFAISSRRKLNRKLLGRVVNPVQPQKWHDMVYDIRMPHYSRMNAACQEDSGGGKDSRLDNSGMRTRVLFEVGVLLLVMVSAQGDQVGPEIGEVRTLCRDQLGVGDYVMGFERTWFAAARDAASTELLDLNPAGVVPCSGAVLLASGAWVPRPG